LPKKPKFTTSSDIFSLLDRKTSPQYLLPGHEQENKSHNNGLRNNNATLGSEITLATTPRNVLSAGDDFFVREESENKLDRRKVESFGTQSVAANTDSTTVNFVQFESYMDQTAGVDRLNNQKSQTRNDEKDKQNSQTMTANNDVQNDNTCYYDDGERV